MERIDLAITISIGMLLLINIIELVVDSIEDRKMLLKREEKENK